MIQLFNNTVSEFSNLITESNSHQPSAIRHKGQTTILKMYRAHHFFSSSREQENATKKMQQAHTAHLASAHWNTSSSPY